VTSPLGTDRIDAILATFRAWLMELNQPPEAPAESLAPFDLSTVVAQFTALRHDVNLQTKAVRAHAEQSAEVLKMMATPTKPPPPVPQQDRDDVLKPLLKAIVDISDSLALALRQTTKAQENAEPLLEALAEFELPEAPEAIPILLKVSSPGFFARLFGAKAKPAAEATDADSEPWAEWALAVNDAHAAQSEEIAALADKLNPMIEGITDGYAMSLRRVERVFEQVGLMPIPAEGEPFDAELMEVVEAISGSDEPSGTVLEEVRRGYRWKGKVFRFAQVKVAR